MTMTRAATGLLTSLAAVGVLAGCGTQAKSGTDGQQPGSSVPTAATTAAAVDSAATATPSEASSTTCLASVLNRNPAAGEQEVVQVQTAAGASVESTQHYPAGAETYDAEAANNGVADIPFTVPSGISGQQIRVTVRTTSGETCSTAFTPR